MYLIPAHRIMYTLCYCANGWCRVVLITRCQTCPVNLTRACSIFKQWMDGWTKKNEFPAIPQSICDYLCFYLI